jgi:dienelactone hydrolase
MAISFECEGCGKAYSVRDELAGQTGQCKQCGHQMIIPLEPDEVENWIDAPEALPQDRATPPMAFRPAPASVTESAVTAPPKAGFFSFGKKERSGLTWALVVLVGIGVRAYMRWDRGPARNRGNANPGGMAPRNPGPEVNRPFDLSKIQAGPIRLPRFPEPGPAVEIEPGVMLREVKLGPAKPPLGSPPGHGGKLWLYLPAGEHAPKSLPCILIAGAGSDLVTGMDLGDGDRPEHLPYVRAGFAVLAFELDGVPEDRRNPTDLDMGRSMFQFLAARSGLVNANVALEYVLRKVPEVDPSRITAAGHSSAGTLALLFAEHEPRLKACVAFAPAIDLEKRFGPQAVAQLKGMGVGDLVVSNSPKNRADRLQAPLFLFHARDDSNVPVEDSEAFAALLQAKGKPVTLDLVPTGEHYDSMINEGIPHAIAWLKGQGAGPTP